MAIFQTASVFKVQIINRLPVTKDSHILTCLQEVKPEKFNDTTAAIGQRYYECLSSWDPHYIAQVCGPTWPEPLCKLNSGTFKDNPPPHYMRDGQAKRSSTKPAASGAAGAIVATGEQLFQVRNNNYGTEL